MSKQYMFSAFTTLAGFQSGNYSKDFLWANGGDWHGEQYGYATFAHEGKSLGGKIVSLEYPAPGQVKATYHVDETNDPSMGDVEDPNNVWVIEVDANAKTATITHRDQVYHDQLYPPYPGYLSLTEDADAVQQAA